MIDIARNLEVVQSKIHAACDRSGRDFSEVKLVAVSKTQSSERILQLAELGIKDFGENRVQELLEKRPQLPDDITWHMIGHLQTNKVKSIIDKVALIHSVDSFRLAKEIDKQAKSFEKTVDILIEINIAGEESKHGIEPAELSEFLAELAAFKNIMVKGIMCLAPYVENPEENRIYFRKMRQMFVDSEALSANNISMQYLSMGMTNDYEVAIEEGANIVRVGTGIFGARD